MLHPFGALIRPGKTKGLIETLRTACEPLRDQMTESRRRAGITGECAWIVPTVIGDFAVGFFEADDPAAMALLQFSEDDFDVWFRKRPADALAVPADGTYTIFANVLGFEWAE